MTFLCIRWGDRSDSSRRLLIWRRRPGCAPGGAVPFFVSPKKGTKERRPQVCDPSAALRGKPASRGLRGAPQNSLRAARSVQTTAASQSTKRVHAALHAPPRKPRAAGAATGGLKSTRAIAALGPQGAGAARRVCGAERSDGPNGLQTPCGCACGAGLAGWRLHRRMQPLRRLTRRGCLNEAAQQRSEFCGAPRKPRDAGLPRSAAKGSQTWGRLSLVPFFGETKKGTAPPGAHPGQQRLQQKQKNHKPNQPPAPASPAPPAIKTTA